MSTATGRLLHSAVLLALCALFVLYPVRAAAQDDYKLLRTRFSGNRTLSAGTLRAAVEQKGPSMWRRALFWKKAPLYDPEQLNPDCTALQRLYQREGFLDIRIAPTLQIDHEKHSIRVVYRIVEGNPGRVGNIVHTFDPPSSAAVLDSLLNRQCAPLRGKRFRDERVLVLQSTLLERVTGRGYAFAECERELHVQPAEHRAYINWHWRTGPRCRLGQTVIEGDTYNTAAFIRHRLAYAPGDWYSPAALEKTQGSIYGLGAFESVTVTTSADRLHGDSLDVLVHVRPMPHQRVQVGGGYGTEDRLRGFFRYRLLHLLQGVERWELYVKHSYLEPWHVTSTFTHPALFYTRTAMSLETFLLRERENSYTLDSYGAGLSLRKPLSNTLRVTTSYKFERNYLRQTSLSASEIEEATDKTLYNKSTIGLSLDYDSATPPQDPTSGEHTGMVLSWSGPGSRYPLASAVVEVRRYTTLTDHLVLATRAQGGAIVTLQGNHVVPVEERFYAGGSRSVRGWARSELGPHDADGVPAGGLSLLEGSAELRYPIWKKLSGVAFLDAGNVWSQTKHYPLSTLRYAAGAGLRLASPVGPLRVDVAAPVFETPHKVQVHLSLGQAF